MTTRDNPDLDDFMADTADANSPKKRRKRRTVKISRDAIKRRAFRVLAVLADMDEVSRGRVLKMADELSRYRRKGKADERA